MCKRGNLQSWESACSHCWQKATEHDLCWACNGSGLVPQRIDNHVSEITKCPNCNGTGYKGKWRQQLMTLNTIREELRACGIDLFDNPW